MAAACQARFGKPVDKLAANDRESLLQDVAAGKVKAGALGLRLADDLLRYLERPRFL